jgi:hypothetical protein
VIIPVNLRSSFVTVPSVVESGEFEMHTGLDLLRRWRTRGGVRRPELFQAETGIRTSDSPSQLPSFCEQKLRSCAALSKIKLAARRRTGQL